MLTGGRDFLFCRGLRNRLHFTENPCRVCRHNGSLALTYCGHENLLPPAVLFLHTLSSREPGEDDTSKPPAICGSKSILERVVAHGFRDLQQVTKGNVYSVVSEPLSFPFQDTSCGLLQEQLDIVVTVELGARRESRLRGGAGHITTHYGCPFDRNPNVVVVLVHSIGQRMYEQVVMMLKPASLLIQAL